VRPPIAGSALTLNAQVLKQQASTTSLRSVVIVGTLRSTAPGVATGSRPVALETYNGVGWSQPVASSTLPNGQATWKLKLRKGTYRLRARWAGAGDLAGSVSPTLALKVS
jgi:hypothetical protein